MTRRVTLTPLMQDALRRAAQQPLRRVHKPGPGQPPWPANPSTLSALVRRDLVAHSRIRNRHGWPTDVWTITDAGVTALKPKELWRKDRPIYLSRPSGRRGDYSTDPSQSIDNDHQDNGRVRPVEVLVTPAHYRSYADEADTKRTERLKEDGRRLDELPLEQRLRNVTTLARAHRVDLHSELRLIRQFLTTGRDKHAAQRLTKTEALLRQRTAA